MKKMSSLSVLLVIILLMSALPFGSVFAFTSNSNKKIEEIVSSSELLADFVKQATFRISSKTLIFSKNSVLSASETGSTMTGKTDTLTLVPLSDLAFIETYNEVVEMRKATSDMVVLTSTGGSTYKYISDNSLTAKLYSTVYYTTNSGGFSSITKITGGITAAGTGSSLDSGVTITENYLLIGQVGFPTDGSGGIVQNDSKTFSNGTRSWTYYPPTSWRPVKVGLSGAIGCSYFVTLKRGTSSWTTILNNNAFLA